MTIKLNSRSTVLFAILLSVFIAFSCKKDSKEEETYTNATLTGTWDYGSGLTGYTLAFTGANSYLLSNSGVSLDQGTYNVNNKELSITPSISVVCSENLNTSKYTITITDNKLTLVNIDDNCSYRMGVLTKGEYTKK